MRKRHVHLLTDGRKALCGVVPRALASRGHASLGVCRRCRSLMKEGGRYVVWFDHDGWLHPQWSLNTTSTSANTVTLVQYATTAGSS